MVLNRGRLLREIDRATQTNIKERSMSKQYATALWQTLVDQQLLYDTFTKNYGVYEGIPMWNGSLGTKVGTAWALDNVHIIGIDGSQIYPDRHQGGGRYCFLLNIGVVVFHYSSLLHGVRFDSFPFVYSTDLITGNWSSEDMVNIRRQELELCTGVDLAIGMQQEFLQESMTDHLLLLFDGSLLFWMLEKKDAVIASEYATKYNACLQQLFFQHIPVAFYISSPMSREFISLLNPLNKNVHHQSMIDITAVCDRDLMFEYLKPYERTQLFICQLSIASLYPPELRPCFFYLHTGYEIARIEVPHYVAHDEELLNIVVRGIMNQVVKGYGYPVILAEAHEQAVIKEVDRLFFYEVLRKRGISDSLSEKMMNKRRIAV